MITKRVLENLTKLNHTTVGFEIELTGITRKDLADIIATLWGTPYKKRGHDYIIFDPKGRTWELIHDGSINALNERDEPTSEPTYKIELVSPPMFYFELLTDYASLFKLLEQNKIVSNARQRCGVHIHIGAKDAHSPASLRNLLALTIGKDEVFNAYVMQVGQRNTYCRPTGEMHEAFTSQLYTRLATQKATSDLELASLWYGSYCNKPINFKLLEGDFEFYKKSKGHPSRYAWLNLHSYFYRGTVEFRGWNFKEFINFNELKAFLQICLAMSYYSINAKSVKPTLDTIEKPNLRYQMHTWGNRIGLIGEEFKEAREIIRQNLSGDIAFNTGVRPSRSAV